MTQGTPTYADKCMGEIYRPTNCWAGVKSNICNFQIRLVCRIHWLCLICASIDPLLQNTIWLLLSYVFHDDSLLLCHSRWGTGTLSILNSQWRKGIGYTHSVAMVNYYYLCKAWRQWLRSLCNCLCYYPLYEKIPYSHVIRCTSLISAYWHIISAWMNTGVCFAIFTVHT